MLRVRGAFWVAGFSELLSEFFGLGGVIRGGGDEVFLVRGNFGEIGFKSCFVIL